MCNEGTVIDNATWLTSTDPDRPAPDLLAGAKSVASGPPVAEVDVRVPTPDGDIDAYFVHPDSGACPGVIIWPDIMGLRPSFRAMGKRLAQSGYAVVVVNPYYRTHQGAQISPGETIQTPGVRERLMPLKDTLSAETAVTDGRALVAWLDEQAAVDSARGIGCAGYCMTGSYGLRLAAALPERVNAAASFHGNGLVTDEDNSPHRLLADVRAGSLIAIAENDDAPNPDHKTLLREAFDAAGLAAEIEVYEGALHGWCPPDSAVYNEPQAERAWSRLLALLQTPSWLRTFAGSGVQTVAEQD